ncbi:hypothetical protein ACFX14_017919 [Malus domestica]
MQSLELKYDEQCDCWVLEPFDGTIHSVSKSLPSPSSFSAPSPSCFTSPTTYFTVPSLPKRREGRFLFGKIVVRFWKFFKPRLYSGTAKNDSNGMRPCGGDDSAKTRSGMQSPLQGQHHAEYYSAMSADERDENLKEVIFYCRKSSSTEPTEVALWSIGTSSNYKCKASVTLALHGSLDSKVHELQNDHVETVKQ